MFKSLTKLTKDIGLLTVALTLALVANFAYGQWADPTGAPPTNNAAAPVNVGISNQIKDGGLGVNALSVFGSAYIQGSDPANLPKGVVTLEVDGIVGATAYCDQNGQNCLSLGTANTGTGLGESQQWYNVTASRSPGVSYQNTTGRPIQVCINGAGSDQKIQVSSNNSAWLSIGQLGTSGLYSNGSCFVVSDAHYYRIAPGGGALDMNAQVWSELRSELSGPQRYTFVTQMSALWTDPAFRAWWGPGVALPSGGWRDNAGWNIRYYTDPVKNQWKVDTRDKLCSYMMTNGSYINGTAVGADYGSDQNNVAYYWNAATGQWATELHSDNSAIDVVRLNCVGDSVSTQGQWWLLSNRLEAPCDRYRCNPYPAPPMR